MKLSVCMIVRDETPRLVAAIESVRAVADEIVVVDTGSTDGTPELAASLGARVASIPWVDDFAAARNHSFSLARGSWILMLDADQRLENPAQLPAPLGGEAYRLRVVDFGVESWRVGLFRASFRMVGRIHEYFDPPLKSVDCGVRLLHDGVFGDAKHRRNLPLLGLELDERPHRLDIRIERARTLAALGNPSALEEALSYIDPLKPPVAGYVVMLLESFLLRPAEQRPPWIEPYALRWFPYSPPLRWILARQAAEQSDFESACLHLERLILMSETRDYDRSVPFDAHLLGSGPRLQLAGVQVRLGHLAEAERGFAALIDDPLNGPAARSNLEVVRSLRRTNNSM